MTDVKCEYCSKSFSNIYNLNKHKKTAVYCIEIQKNTFKLEPTVTIHICEYCDQEFTTKCNYIAHIGVCKVKKENDLLFELNRTKEELSRIKKEHDLQSMQILQVNKDLELLRTLYDEKEKQFQKYENEKEEEIKQLKEQIREKDEYIQNTPHTTIYQTNNNSKYEFNFQAVFDKLAPFTEENVKERVLSILPRHLIEGNNYNLLLNFCSNFGRKMADMAILTDKSRGLIFIKNKDGEREKHQVKGFVNKCLIIGQPECIKLFNSTRNLIEMYGLREEIMPEDEAKCFGDLTILREYLTTKTLDKTVKTISGVLTDNCSYISKLPPGTIEQKMIEELD